MIKKIINTSQRSSDFFGFRSGDLSKRVKMEFREVELETCDRRVDNEIISSSIGILKEEINSLLEYEQDAKSTS